MTEKETFNTLDYTCNGECSRCGECCTPLLPLTLDEIKVIKDYIKEKDIKPVSVIRGNNIYFRCPFYDPDKKCCNIYEVRPEVCRAFTCHNKYKQINKNRHYYDKRADINGNHLNRFVLMDYLFYGDPCLTLLFLTKHLGADTPQRLLNELYSLGADRKFFKETGLNSTHDIIKGMYDGSIKLEWSDK